MDSLDDKSHVVSWRLAGQLFDQLVCNHLDRLVVANDGLVGQAFESAIDALRWSLNQTVSIEHQQVPGPHVDTGFGPFRCPDSKRKR